MYLKEFGMLTRLETQPLISATLSTWRPDTQTNQTAHWIGLSFAKGQVSLCKKRSFVVCQSAQLLFAIYFYFVFLRVWLWHVTFTAVRVNAGRSSTTLSLIGLLGFLWIECGGLAPEPWKVNQITTRLPTPTCHSDLTELIFSLGKHHYEQWWHCWLLEREITLHRCTRRL